jgi:hypothetical protein
VLNCFEGVSKVKTVHLGFGVIALNDISWLTVLLVGETRVPGENPQPVACH